MRCCHRVACTGWACSRRKVAEFADLVASLRAAASMLEELWPLHIARLPPGSVDERCIIVPDLVPPIDRQYTVRFFTGGTTLPADDQQPLPRCFLPWPRSLSAPDRPSTARWSVAVSWRPAPRK